MCAHLDQACWTCSQRFAIGSRFFSWLLVRMVAWLGLGVCFPGGQLHGQPVLGENEERIIHYDSSEGLLDPVSRLEKRLDSGKAGLAFEPQHGYLSALLKALGVRLSSQGLVFSKTSSQAEYTSPTTPRAVFFSDEVSVAWVPDAPEIDIASVDPNRGPIFYTLRQDAKTGPKFVRRQECLQCHFGIKTLQAPAMVVRSVYTAPDGHAVAKVDGFVNGHSSPLELRWGGWYVTGNLQDERGADPQGASLAQTIQAPSSAPRVEQAAFIQPGSTHPGPGQQHLGNLFVSDAAYLEELDTIAGANVTDLRSRFNTSAYLSPHSDVVALLVLEHQVRMQNLLTHANYETRYALDEMNRPHGDEQVRDGGSDWPRKRIALAGEMVLEYMLFRNEAPLRGPVTGTSAFATEFQRIGPCTSDGQSLRQLDLRTRLMRYPCSFLIYSGSFEALPKEMKHYLWRRLGEILGGQDRSPIYATMALEDRQNVMKILRATKPEFAAWLKKPTTELDDLSRP